MSEETIPYDSAPDTREHIANVKRKMLVASTIIAIRGDTHDLSKLEDPIEKAAFDRGTPALKGLTYGSDEYRRSFKENGMEEGIARHYAGNPHHPEYYKNGIAGMSLFDILEMVCDWKAASERHANGDFGESLVINRSRFKIEPQVFSAIVNFSRSMEFVEKDWQPRFVINKWMRTLANAWMDAFLNGCDPMYDNTVAAMQKNIIAATGFET